jgi:hypothetical protein
MQDNELNVLLKNLRSKISEGKFVFVAQSSILFMAGRISCKDGKRAERRRRKKDSRREIERTRGKMRRRKEK